MSGAVPLRVRPEDEAPGGEAALLADWARLTLLAALLEEGHPALPYGAAAGPGEALDLPGLAMTLPAVLHLLDAARAPETAEGARQEAVRRWQALTRPGRGPLAAALARLPALGIPAGGEAALALVLAAELEERVGRAIGFLADDLARRRPSFGLLARLLAPDRDAEAALAAALARMAATGLVLATEGEPGSGHAAHAPAPCLLRLARGLPAAEGEAPPRGTPLPPDLAALVAPAAASLGDRPALVQVMLGSPAEDWAWAGALLRALDRPRLAAGPVAVPAEPPAAASLGRQLALGAGLTGGAAVLACPGEAGEGSPALAALLRPLAGAGALVVVLGGQRLAPGACPEALPCRVLEAPPPGRAARRAAWQDAALAVGSDLDPAALDRLALLPLGQGAIARAAEEAAQAGWPARPPDAAALLAAAARPDPAAAPRFARRIPPGVLLDRLVLPPDRMAQLRELAAQVRHGPQVLRDWGFGALMPAGQGTAALFAGPSGTGKTFAARALAGELELDLLQIDLSQVVSKYIGETEKNLSAVFAAAESGRVALLFDEADALFGKRSEVRDAHDRYANIETAYLLQRLEAFAGLAILTTNLKPNLDTAFLRRLHVVIDFPRPDAPQRAEIWRRAFPAAAPLESGLDLDDLAEQAELTGGHIQAAALRAAYLAAAEGAPIGLRHLVYACRREMLKLGLLSAERGLARLAGEGA